MINSRVRKQNQNQFKQRMLYPMFFFFEFSISSLVSRKAFVLVAEE